MQERRKTVSIGAAAFCAAVLLGSGGWCLAAQDAVRILGHTVEPELFSPGDPDGILDHTELSAEVAVRKVCGLEATGRRSARSDVKRFVLRSRWEIAGGGREAMAVLHAESVISPSLPTVSLPAGSGRGTVPFVVGRISLMWDGSDNSGRVLEDGTYRYILTASAYRVDELGNGRVRVDPIGAAGPVTGSMTVDSTPPVILVLDVPDCTSEDVVPVIEIDDAHPGEVLALLDGEPYVPGTPVTVEGEHVLVVTATDLAGNRADHSVVFVIDRTAPVIVLSGVDDGASVPAPVSVDVEVTEEHAVSVTVLLDGAPYASGTPILEPGDHVLTVVVEDCAGHMVEAILEFTLVDDGAPATVLFSNVDDPGLLRTGEMRADGWKDPYGLATGVSTLRFVGPGDAEALARFDAEGELRSIRSVNGYRLELEHVAGGPVLVTYVEEGAAVRSTRTFQPVTGEPAAIPGRIFGIGADPGTALGRSSPAREERTGLRHREPERSFRHLDEAPPSSPTVEPPPAGGRCSGSVVLAACDVAVDDAEVRLRVDPSMDFPEGYTVPALHTAGGVYHYDIPCVTGPVPGSTEMCESIRRAATGPCESLANLDRIGTGTICSMLADNLAHLSPARDAGARAEVEARCSGLLRGAMEACGGVRDACSTEHEPLRVDRRSTGELQLLVEVESDALGPLAESGTVEGTGPFPSFDPRAEGAVRIVRFRADRTGPGLYEVVGEVACAPDRTRMRYLSEICDMDRNPPYCFPYDVSEYVSGRGSFGLQYDGSGIWDLVRVTLQVDGLPTRIVVFRF